MYDIEIPCTQQYGSHFASTLEHLLDYFFWAFQPEAVLVNPSHHFQPERDKASDHLLNIAQHLAAKELHIIATSWLRTSEIDKYFFVSYTSHDSCPAGG